MSHSSEELKIPGLVLVEHEVEVPLDHADPEAETITVFCREVADPDGRDRPFLVYLQGGPGFESPRPTANPSSPGWLARALKDYRVLMLDQRGTGRSSPVGSLAGLTPQQQADRLALFRADSIVADAEVVRQALGVDRWSVLGQSFGGFCALRYLSSAPQSLNEALFTGGVPPIGTAVDEIYATTFAIMRQRNRRYYQRYPADRARVSEVVERCAAGEITLPSGDVLTARRFRSLGNALGMSDGAEGLHYLLELDPSSRGFQHDVAAMVPFGSRNPLYAVIHEACYADGQSTRWSSYRVMPDDFRDDETLLFGEHVFPWTFEDDSALTPLREAADLLAQREWPALYDADALAACEVPCAAAIYAEDPYVPWVFSQQTADLLPRMTPWITNEYQHNGLRVDGERILDRLIGLARGTAS